MNELTPISKNLQQRKFQSEVQTQHILSIKKYFFKRYQKKIRIINLQTNKLTIQVPTASLAANIQLEKESILIELTKITKQELTELFIRIG